MTFYENNRYNGKTSNSSNKNVYKKDKSRPQKKSKKEKTPSKPSMDCGNLLHYFCSNNVAIFCIIFALTTGKGGNLLDSIVDNISISQGTPKLKRYAKEHGLLLSDYPQKLIELYERNPETKQFVFESSVPLFLQWDQRWGYEQYSGDLLGLTGCGPTCLSMVSVYLTGDTTMTPSSMAKFAESHGYASTGNGSSWTLFSEGGVKLGFDVTEIPLVEKRIVDNLNVGNPIVAIMGPGDFTTTGHFIVLTGYKDGKIKINDPNSKKNSEKLWDFSKIKGQIRNLWVFRAGS